MRKLSLFLFFVTLLACNKNDLEPKFYEQDRTVFKAIDFSDLSGWNYEIESGEIGDTAYVNVENSSLNLYARGWAYCTASMSLEDWNADIMCFEIGFKRFKGQYYPWGTSDIPLVTSSLIIEFNDQYIYRDRSKGSFDISNAPLHIYINKENSAFKVFLHGEDKTEAFRCVENYDGSQKNTLKIGSKASDYYGMKEECETIVDYVLFYTVQS